MKIANLFALSVLSLILNACGGGGGEGASTGGGASGGSDPQPVDQVDLSEYRIDENSNIFLNRNNGDEIAAIVFKEFLFQSLGASTKGLGTVFDGPLMTDSQTVGISHTLVRTFEFLEANYPNQVFNSPNCGETPVLVVTTDENMSGDYDAGDSIDLAGCDSNNVSYTGGYGVDDLLFTGQVQPNSVYEISGTFRIAGFAVGNGTDQLFESQEAGSLRIVSNQTNEKTVIFNGSFGADYNRIVNNSVERFAGSAHQNRQIEVVYTPGSDYTVSGQYDFVGNFDNVFNRSGTSFRMSVRNLDISGLADGSIQEGSFRVLGADSSSLIFMIRNDGTFVFSSDEDGDGIVDFTSGSIDIGPTIGKFTF